MDFPSKPDSDLEVRSILKRIMWRKDRPQIALVMTKDLGRRITVNMLNDFVRESKSGAAKFPLCYLEAFCQAVGDDSLKRFILGPRLCELLELGERVAAILDERARRRVLKVPINGFAAGEKRNGSPCTR
jgi:hypothetical protein